MSFTDMMTNSLLEIWNLVWTKLQKGQANAKGFAIYVIVPGHNKFLPFSPALHLYSAANDPRPQMIPRPEMIPKLDPNDPEPQMIPMWTANDPRRKRKNGMEFGFLDFPIFLFYFYIHLVSSTKR